MTDMYETTPVIGEMVTPQNEHLIPFGSTVSRRNLTKFHTGWFQSGNPYTHPVMGYPLTTLGDGGLETLAEFKVRVRATVLSRMQYEGIAGWDEVQERLASIGILDVEEFRAGMTVAHPLDFSDDRVSHLLIEDHMPRNRMRWAKQLATVTTGTVPLVMRVAPINDEPVWTSERGTWADWVFTKRALWEAGERLASNHGWCGTFGNVMSALGIDGQFTGAVGATANARANFPVGA